MNGRGFTNWYNGKLDDFSVYFRQPIGERLSWTLLDVNKLSLYTRRLNVKEKIGK